MSGVTLEFVTDDEDGIRLDRWFRNHYPGVGHGQLQKLLRKGQVRVDGKKAKANERLSSGQRVRVPPHKTAVNQSYPPLKKPKSRSREDARFIESLVIHRDSKVLVLNKPSGLAVQGGSKTRRHLDGLLNSCNCETGEKPKLVHRLDKDTSGVLVVALTASTARHFAEAFRQKTARKLYWAAVVGVPSPLSGRIDLALSKAAGQGRWGREQVFADDKHGKQAITYYETLDRIGRKISWLGLFPLTGRTHQLRAHTSALGTPILGDRKYGGLRAIPAIEGIEARVHLHARALRLPHPDGGLLDVIAPMPDHMDATWRTLGFNQGDHAGPVAWPDL